MKQINKVGLCYQLRNSNLLLPLKTTTNVESSRDNFETRGVFFFVCKETRIATTDCLRSKSTAIHGEGCCKISMFRLSYGLTAERPENSAREIWRTALCSQNGKESRNCLLSFIQWSISKTM